MEIKFKNFRSPGEPIRVASTSGHTAYITSDFAPVPSSLWSEAYAAGAVSEDMVSKDVNDYIESKKAEKAEEEAKDRESIKNSLRSVFNSPVGILDDKGRVIHRKAIAAIGKPVKKDLIDELWAELVEEAE